MSFGRGHFLVQKAAMMVLGFVGVELNLPTIIKAKLGNQIEQIAGAARTFRTKWLTESVPAKWSDCFVALVGLLLGV